MTENEVTVTQALEPCPFCGGEGEISIFMKGDSKNVAGFFVECSSCSAGGEPFDIQGEAPDREDYTKQKSIAAWNTRAQHRTRSVREELDAYDAGLLSDYGGGDVEWWQNYIRYELERAHDFYQSQVASPKTNDSVDAVREALAQRMAESVGLAWDTLPDKPDIACGHGMPEGCREYWQALASLQTQPAARDVVDRDWTIERDSEGEAMVCTGCGTTRTLDHIRYINPKARSCCPERSMIPVRQALVHAALLQPAGEGL